MPGGWAKVGGHGKSLSEGTQLGDLLEKGMSTLLKGVAESRATRMARVEP